MLYFDILVDAWAEWCEACKKMDVTTFADANVQEELQKHWILLKLDLTESNDEKKATCSTLHLITRLYQIKESVLNAARNHFGDSNLADDVTIVVAEISKSWAPQKNFHDSSATIKFAI